jgi:hypothetical protein
MNAFVCCVMNRAALRVGSSLAFLAHCLVFSITTKGSESVRAASCADGDQRLAVRVQAGTKFGLQ